jgi:hypothetical protein
MMDIHLQTVHPFGSRVQTDYILHRQDNYLGSWLKISYHAVY